jgi:hypothetical protein
MRKSEGEKESFVAYTGTRLLRHRLRQVNARVAEMGLDNLSNDNLSNVQMRRSNIEFFTSPLKRRFCR